eukprot:scaffold37278_cov178-Skeletonema_dohrnii-CCMP3373.AAC.2
MIARNRKATATATATATPQIDMYREGKTLTLALCHETVSTWSQEDRHRVPPLWLSGSQSLLRSQVSFSSCFALRPKLALGTWRGVSTVVHDVLRPADATIFCARGYSFIDLSCDMKALAFLSSLSSIRSRSHHPWGATQRQNRQQPPTHQLTSIHHHDVSSSALFLRSSNEHHDDYNHTTIDDDNSESNEAPSIVRCSTQNDFHHIYQMNAAALQQLFTKQQQCHDDNITQQSANDSSDASRISSSRISTDSSHIFIERVLNCTTAIDDTSTSISDYDSEVYFVAIQHDNDISTNDDNILLQSAIADNDYTSLNDLPSTNNEVAIMGIVAIQLRHKSPLIAGPSTITTLTNNNNNTDDISDDNSDNKCNPRGDGNSDLPAVALPTPHFYILTVQVDEQFRQRGIGLSLLHDVVEYCKGCSEQLSHRVVGLQQQQQHDNGDDSIGESNNENLLLHKLRQRQQNRRNKYTDRGNSKSYTNDEERIPIVLSVDTDNIPAVRLYEKFGFEYLERNDVFCMMVLRP